MRTTDSAGAVATAAITGHDVLLQDRTAPATGRRLAPERGGLGQQETLPPEPQCDAVSLQP
jgi:hypothetical protein